MLTIAKLHGESVAYYESTVGNEPGQTVPESGPDSYYSEDGTKPARAWIAARSRAQSERVSARIGVEVGAEIRGDSVRDWFNKALAPSGEKLGRAPKSTGVPGFDLTFCAPKSVSVLWGFGSESVRQVVDAAHAQAVSEALSYLSEHAGYTRRADDFDRDLMVIDRVEALSGVKYEHRTSRAGDPHVHSHVLLANKQLCADGKWRTLDGVSLYHEARAAGTIYQATLRETLAKQFGVAWSDVTNGCAEIAGLDDTKMLKAFSTRANEIEKWREENSLDDQAAFERIGQKKTRQTKDLDVSLDELERRWRALPEAEAAEAFVGALDDVEAEGQTRTGADVALPSVEEILDAVVAERSTFTRADVVEKIAEMMPVGVVAPADMLAAIEHLADSVVEPDPADAEQAAWPVTPEKSRKHDKTAREGSQRFTSRSVVSEVDRAIDLACEKVYGGVAASEIKPIEGALSIEQADAMRTVVASPYRASVVVAPAGAGKTSSLKAARKAWESAGKTVVGLAPTGKAADVMVGEDVAHSSATIARALKRAEDEPAEHAAVALGWDTDTVIVVDEAGMVSTPDLVRVLDIARAAGSRVVMVGDPHQYGAVKARGGLLATLAYELPDAVELTEVFRQHDPAERDASKWLRSGEAPYVERAADFYAKAERLFAGSSTAMLEDALAGWKTDVEAGKQSLLVASTNDYADALNAAAQKTMAARGVLDMREAVKLTGSQFAHVGNIILTRRNNYDLVTSAGDVVRNGQRWRVEAIHADGSITARRSDDTGAAIVLSPDYLGEHTQLGYASTGHSAQGATVDVARVVAGVGQIDRAGVYVPMTRGREGNFLYLAEQMPGDTEAGHGKAEPTERRESTDYARDLLVQAATRSRTDETPYDVFRQARADWELTHLATGTRWSIDPARGAYMRKAAQAREDARIKRLRDFVAPAAAQPGKQDEKPTTAPQQQPKQEKKSPDDGPDMSLVQGNGPFARNDGRDRSRVQGHDRQAGKPASRRDDSEDYAAQRERLNSEIAALREQISAIDQQSGDLESEQRYAQTALEHARAGQRVFKNSLREARAKRDGRSRIAKWFNPNAGQETIDSIETELAREDASHDKWSQRNEELLQVRDELRQRRADLNEQIKSKKSRLVWIDVEERSADALERLQQQQSRGYSTSSEQQTWEMPQEQSNDSGMEL